MRALLIALLALSPLLASAQEQQEPTEPKILTESQVARLQEAQTRLQQAKDTYEKELLYIAWELKSDTLELEKLPSGKLAFKPKKDDSKTGPK